MAVESFSGVRLVARGGSVVSTRCDGFADRDAGLPWSADTPSQIGSISKQVAAAVALVLVDRGTLGLDDAVADLLPVRAPQWRDVSIRHLLTHTSGMSHWCELPGFDPAVPLDARDRLDHLLQARLVDPPGRTWRYSSPGYIVLSAVLEHAAQRRYADLVDDLIIERLSLTRTTVGVPRGSRMARGYRQGREITPWDLHTMPGTGDIWSTAADLARFVTALHSGELLPAQAHALLHEVSVPRDAERTVSPVIAERYGLGHFIGTVNGAAAYLHPGDNPGYQALATWLPTTDTTVVALGNEETDDIEVALAEALRESTVECDQA